MRGLRAMLLASLTVTEGILFIEGRWQEALPLHLCGAAAIAALDFAFFHHQAALDFLWYLGIPGAALALLFPAPAVSRYQRLLNASYVATHALIIAIPLYGLAKGRRVRRRREGRMLLALHLLAAMAFAANLLLGTDYLFLMAPPAGTPLCAPYAYGKAAYLFTLEMLACAMVFVMGRGFTRIWPSAIK